MKIFQDSNEKKENFELSIESENLNYSENSSFIKNIEENNANNKKITFLKHKFSMIQKHLLNFINNLEQLLMDDVINIYDLFIIFIVLLKFLRSFTPAVKNFSKTLKESKD